MVIAPIPFVFYLYGRVRSKRATQLKRVSDGVNVVSEKA